MAEEERLELSGPEGPRISSPVRLPISPLFYVGGRLKSRTPALSDPSGFKPDCQPLGGIYLFTFDVLRQAKELSQLCRWVYRAAALPFRKPFGLAGGGGFEPPNADIKDRCRNRLANPQFGEITRSPRVNFKIALEVAYHLRLVCLYLLTSGASTRIRTEDPDLEGRCVTADTMDALFGGDVPHPSTRWKLEGVLGYMPHCLVGVAGLEPATLWSQTRCATRLRYTP